MYLVEDTRQQSGKHDLKHSYFTSHNIGVVRSKLPFGDYAPVPPVSIDTKANMDEIAANICGKHISALSGNARPRRKQGVS